MTALAPLLRDQRKIDADHLRLLAIFHFVLAALAVVGLGFLFLHWSVMHAFLDNPDLWKDQKGGPPPKEFFKVFRWFYVFFAAILVFGGVLNMVSGFCLRRRTARVFSLVVAGINVLQFPFGTTLGVFTFIVLLRESVVEAYGAANPIRFYRR